MLDIFRTWIEGDQVDQQVYPDPYFYVEGSDNYKALLLAKCSILEHIDEEPAKDPLIKPLDLRPICTTHMYTCMTLLESKKIDKRVSLNNLTKVLDMCWFYASKNKRRLFYLSCNRIQGLDPQQVSRMLKQLIKIGIIQVIAKGERYSKGETSQDRANKEATMYQWIDGTKPSLILPTDSAIEPRKACRAILSRQEWETLHPEIVGEIDLEEPLQIIGG